MGSNLNDDCGATPAVTACARSRELDVFVLFTEIPATLSALRTAAQLAQGLTSRIRLLLVETVPFPRELDSPQRDIRFLGRQFRTLVDSCAAETSSRSVETFAEIMLCRDAWEALNESLPPNSVVVIGKRSRWWRRNEDRLARKLRAAGHHVVRTSAASAPGLPQFGWKGLANA